MWEGSGSLSLLDSVSSAIAFSVAQMKSRTEEGAGCGQQALSNPIPSSLAALLVGPARNNENQDNATNSVCQLLRPAIIYLTKVIQSANMHALETKSCAI